MRVFLAGASGVLGRNLIPLLVDAGHEVLGTTRSPGKVDDLTALGAAAAVCDVYDADRLLALVTDFDPDVVLHELTDLPDTQAELASRREGNARIRVEGTRNLLRAARAVGAPRFLAQSVAWSMPPGSGADAVAELERTVLEYGGVVLRYGQLYGPGTFYEDEQPTDPRVSVTDAAVRTVAALDAPSGVLTITD